MYGNVLLKTFSARLGIVVPMDIFRVFHIKKRAHPCCIHLEDSAPSFLMVRSASTIINSSLCEFFFNMFYHIFTDRVRQWDYPGSLLWRSGWP